MSDISDYFKKQQDLERNRFGTESMIQQILWDGQVEDEYFNDTFCALVQLAKACIENDEAKRQLYEINLDDYPIEEE
ncbi:MAG: hypothetical protein AAF620_15310 [Bacteroidota bacterium]